MPAIRHCRISMICSSPAGAHMKASIQESGVQLREGLVEKKLR